MCPPGQRRRIPPDRIGFPKSLPSAVRICTIAAGSESASGTETTRLTAAVEPTARTGWTMISAAEGEVTINGHSTPLNGVAAWTTALDFLREQGLTGCKEGCAEGECGACSVLIARPGMSAPTEWVAINACLLPAAALEGQEVITSEGLAGGDALHPVQHE